MATPGSLPVPGVALTNPEGLPTQAFYEFLLRLDSVTKSLFGVANIFDGLTATQATALLNIFSSTLKGLVPASGGGTANYLRADVSWATPPVGTGGMDLLSSAGVGAGTTYSVTGLGGYKLFMIVLRNVSHNNGASQTFRIELSGDNGGSYGTPLLMTPGLFAGTPGIYGFFVIDRIDQTNSQAVVLGSPFTPAVTPEDASSRGPINALRFSFSAGNFDAGAIDIYGFK